MNNKQLIVVGLLGFGAWWYWKKSQSNESYFVDITDTLSNDLTDFGGYAVGKINDALTGSFMFTLSKAKTVNAAMLQNSNIKAFLLMIRKGEGTLGPNGYKMLFGGQLFNSYVDHPRVIVKKSGYSSSAAGAYQFLSKTWDETAKVMGLVDFSPSNQDLGALGRIAIRGALDDVIAGRFELAVKKCANEWASLPFSKYGQPTQSITAARDFYKTNGGVEVA